MVPLRLDPTPAVVHVEGVSDPIRMVGPAAVPGVRVERQERSRRLDGHQFIVVDAVAIAFGTLRPEVRARDHPRGAVLRGEVVQHPDHVQGEHHVPHERHVPVQRLPAVLGQGGATFEAVQDAIRAQERLREGDDLGLLQGFPEEGVPADQVVAAQASGLAGLPFDVFLLLVDAVERRPEAFQPLVGDQAAQDRIALGLDFFHCR